MIGAGRLRHRLVLEEAVSEEDGSGGFTVSWTEAAVVWGRIEAVSGRETFARDRVKSEASHRITIRHRDDVGPAKRFRFKTRVFEIASVLDPDESRRMLVCQCVENSE